MIYFPATHYWLVGQTERVWSAAGKDYVLRTNAAYVAWLATGNAPTRIESESSLWEVLADQAPESLPAQAQNVRQQRRVQAIDAVVLEILFGQENRLRALEKQPALSRATFRAMLAERL